MYTVMLFGPTIRPATFINFIHDVDSQLKALTKSLDVVINNNTKTKIILDNIFSWATTLGMALLYMECQLRVCQYYLLEEEVPSSSAL
jgi:hypothetical protein